MDPNDAGKMPPQRGPEAQLVIFLPSLIQLFPLICHSWTV